MYRNKVLLLYHLSVLYYGIECFRDHVGHKCVSFDVASKTVLIDLVKLLEISGLRKTSLQEAVRKVDSAMAAELQE